MLAAFAHLTASKRVGNGRRLSGWRSSVRDAGDCELIWWGLPIFRDHESGRALSESGNGEQ
jgi:hypothetical protein